LFRIALSAKNNEHIPLLATVFYICRGDCYLYRVCGLAGMVSVTISERLEKQRKFRMRKYAGNLVYDKTGLMMDDFKLRTRIYGREWAESVWALCREIKNESIPKKD